MFGNLDLKKDLSENELELLHQEFSIRKVKESLVWLLWACGFFGIYGLHTIPLKETKKGLIYIVATIAMWLSVILIFIFLFNSLSVTTYDSDVFQAFGNLIICYCILLLLSVGIIVLWIIDAIKLKSKITPMNDAIEKKIIEEILELRETKKTE